MRCAWVLALLLAGCGDGNGDVDAGAPVDLGIPDIGALTDGVPALRGAFTITGCSTLDTSTGHAEVQRARAADVDVRAARLGRRHLRVDPDAAAMPSTSKAIAPSVTYGTPGVYPVTLAAGGTRRHHDGDGDRRRLRRRHRIGLPRRHRLRRRAPGCSAYASRARRAASARSASASARATARARVCAAGEMCVDLARGGAYVAGGGDDGGASGDVWRRALCLPVVQPAPSDCRAGLLCRELPALAPGGVAGGAYTWKQGCFADIGGDDGDACAVRERTARRVALPLGPLRSVRRARAVQLALHDLERLPDDGGVRDLQRAADRTCAGVPASLRRQLPVQRRSAARLRSGEPGRRPRLLGHAGRSDGGALLRAAALHDGGAVRARREAARPMGGGSFCLRN